MAAFDNNQTPLPSNLAACQKLIQQQRDELQRHRDELQAQSSQLAIQGATLEEMGVTIERLEAERSVLEREKQKLQEEFDAYVQRMFQSRRERYIQDPNQLLLDLGATPEAEDVTDGLKEAVEESCGAADEEQLAPPAKQRRKQKRRAKSGPERFPAHLRRVEIPVDVPEGMGECPTHGARQLIDYDVVEKLCIKRPEIYVEVRKYPKFVCTGAPECGVASPERPTGLVAGDAYDTSVAAEVIGNKYGYHQPIYRQQDWFASAGWTPSRSTLLNFLVASAFVTKPLIEYFRRQLLEGGLAGTDDTRVTLLLPKQMAQLDPNDPKSARILEVFEEAQREGKPSINAKMWVYRGVEVPLNVFDFTVSRHRDGPDRFLEGFVGKIMADCYSGYQGITLRTNGAIERGACNAHSRRKVLAGETGYPKEAAILLAHYQLLYDIEAQAKAMSPGERLEYRQRHAVPVWVAMREWLDSAAAQQLTPKSNLAKARQYMLNHWEPLQLYLTDGRLPIDNNDAEQLMRTVALGRKNWQFVGSIAAGERAADFLTLVSSAVRNDLDVWAYVKDVLDQLLAGSTDYESLRPDAWRQTHPEAVRTYREEERRDRADRKQRSRDARRAKRRAGLTDDR